MQAYLTSGSALQAGVVKLQWGTHLVLFILDHSELVFWQEVGFEAGESHKGTVFLLLSSILHTAWTLRLF